MLSLPSYDPPNRRLSSLLTTAVCREPSPPAWAAVLQADEGLVHVRGPELLTRNSPRKDVWVPPESRGLRPRKPRKMATGHPIFSLETGGRSSRNEEQLPPVPWQEPPNKCRWRPKTKPTKPLKVKPLAPNICRVPRPHDVCRNTSASLRRHI